jgi:hypothetical protein
MSSDRLFAALSSTRIAALIRSAATRVVYAAPGIQDAPTAALLELKEQLLHPELTISLDFDEQTIRMGYGSMEAVGKLRVAGIEPLHFPGFRSGILIVDRRGWIFSPVARYLEDEPQSEEAPNAIELSSDQVETFAIRFSPLCRQKAIEEASTPEIAAELAEMPCELGVAQITQEHFEEVMKAIQTAPPVKFDVVRQVRVFEPYLQYVEMSLTGAAIQKHKVRIPPSIQSLGSSKDLEGRLRTTFALIEKSSALSSKKLEDELNEIRKNLTRTLGKEHGRVVLKSTKPTLDARIESLREKLEDHQKAVCEKLGKQLADSRKQVVEYYLPLVFAKPPDAVIGQSLSEIPTKDDCRAWIDQVLEGVFPTAEKLIQGMTLEITYKEATFETLNRPEFLESIKKAYPVVNWDKAYSEFRAAGETRKSKPADENGANKG